MSDDDVPLSDLAERLGLDGEGDGVSDDVPVDPPSAEAADGPDASDDGEPRAADDRPLEELADCVRTRTADEDADAESSPFESMDVGAVDGEEVWGELFDDDDGGGEFVGVGGEAERVGEGTAYAEFVVEKAEFCKQCPFLGDPPELHCTHEGTDIVEVVDTEHFRVRECPMVDDGDDRFTDI
jgi:hypothetical protein